MGLLLTHWWWRKKLLALGVVGVKAYFTTMVGIGCVLAQFSEQRDNLKAAARGDASCLQTLCIGVGPCLGATYTPKRQKY